jgi:hypothetical protein
VSNRVVSVFVCGEFTLRVRETFDFSVRQKANFCWSLKTFDGPTKNNRDPDNLIGSVKYL